MRRCDLTLSQVRTFTLSLPQAREVPHFDRTSFRVRGKIFATARPEESHIHVFVGDPVRDQALALYADHMSKLWWGKKVVGLRVELAKAPVEAVKDMLRAAWIAKAPKSLAAMIMSKHTV
jgi:hypothetical protein